MKFKSLTWNMVSLPFSAPKGCYLTIGVRINEEQEINRNVTSGWWKMKSSTLCSALDSGQAHLTGTVSPGSHCFGGEAQILRGPPVPVGLIEQRLLPVRGLGQLAFLAEHAGHCRMHGIYSVSICHRVAYSALGTKNTRFKEPLSPGSS